MEYVINDVIKRLKKAQKKGKELITEKELIQIATPEINMMDVDYGVINKIDKAIKTIKRDNLWSGDGDWLVHHVTFTEAAKHCIASRQTLYRWLKKGIIDKDSKYIDLIKLRETILRIKKIHE
jgi:DNA invertase Pin-like site-specific DNA recombinase